MADNVQITPGVGVTISADQLGTGEEVQYVKLMDGTPGSNNKSIIDKQGYLYVENSNNDAFGRVRVSTPATLFDSTMRYGDNTLIWEQVLAGSASVTSNTTTSALDMHITSASGDQVVRQSHRYCHYQPGKSIMVIMSFVMGAIKANTRQRVGYFDASNGIFLQQDGTTRSLVLRTSTSGSVSDANAIPQASWNLDKLDGTGSSGYTLDTTKTQIFVVDFQWLGVGRVRCGFDIDGDIYWCHQFLNANTTFTTVYMQTATLPVRFELTATGTVGSTTTMSQICSTVMTEPGLELDRGVQYSVGNGATTITVSTRRPVLSIRPALTYNSVSNHVGIQPTKLEVYTNQQNLYWEVIYNGTLTGASFASAGTSSAVMYDVAATAISGGIRINSGYVGSGAGPQSELDWGELPITIDITGTVADTISIVCSSLLAVRRHRRH